MHTRALHQGRTAAVCTKYGCAAALVAYSGLHTLNPKNPNVKPQARRARRC